MATPAIRADARDELSVLINLTHQELDACIRDGGAVIVSRHSDGVRGKVEEITLESEPVEYAVSWEDGRRELKTRDQFVVELLR